MNHEQKSDNFKSGLDLGEVSRKDAKAQREGEVRECESARVRELEWLVWLGIAACLRATHRQATKLFFNRILLLQKLSLTETSYNVSTPKFDNFSIENFSLFFSIDSVPKKDFFGMPLF